MRPFGTGVCIAALILASPAPGRGSSPAAAPAGEVEVVASPQGMSVRCASATPEEVRSALLARAGLRLFLPEDLGERISVSFTAVPVREAMLRLGAALGGLVPVQVSPSASAVSGQEAHRTEIYLVRGGTRRRRLLEAYTLSGEGRGRRLLFEGVLREGPDMVPEIVGLAEDPGIGEGRRILAVKLLGALGDPTAVTPLARLLREHPAPLTREAAAITLGWLDHPSAAPPLRRALSDPEAGVGLAAAWALVRHGDPAGVPLALERLGDPRSDLALRAIEVLEAAGDPRHIPALQAVAAGARGPLRARARAAVTAIPLAGLTDAERAAACERLLAGADPEARRVAAARLASMEGAGPAGALARAAADAAHPGRREAAEAERRRDESVPAGTVVLD